MGLKIGVWKTSTHSYMDGNCIELRATTVTGITGGEQHRMVMRDTKQVRRAGVHKVARGEASVPVQTYTLQQWHAFIAAIKAGRLDGPLFGDVSAVDGLGDADLSRVKYSIQLDLGGLTLAIQLMHTGRWAGRFVWSASGQPAKHRFTIGEMAAFILAAKDGEFDLTPEQEDERQRTIAA